MFEFLKNWMERAGSQSAPKRQPIVLQVPVSWRSFFASTRLSLVTVFALPLFLTISLWTAGNLQSRPDMEGFSMWSLLLGCFCIFGTMSLANCGPNYFVHVFTRQMIIEIKKTKSPFEKGLFISGIFIARPLLAYASLAIYLLFFIPYYSSGTWSATFDSLTLPTFDFLQIYGWDGASVGKFLFYLSLAASSLSSLAALTGAEGVRAIKRVVMMPWQNDGWAALYISAVTGALTAVIALAIVGSILIL